MCRGLQGHPHGIFWELHVPTICLWCCYIIVYVATNVFMVLHVDVLWSYMGNKVRVAINLSTKIYLKKKGGGWKQTTLYANLINDIRFDMCKISTTRLSYIKNTSWIAYISKACFSTSTFELIFSCSYGNNQIL